VPGALTSLPACPDSPPQAVGQLTYLRPYVTDFSPEWLAGSTLALVAGAMSLVYIADTISELKLGNGTSVLIFAGIASSLPASVGALLAQNASDDPGNVAVYAAAFFLTTLGIIYVQEAERRIPINYSSRYQAGALARQSYLPFKVSPGTGRGGAGGRGGRGRRRGTRRRALSAAASAVVPPTRCSPQHTWPRLPDPRLCRSTPPA
jgi:hypothetical protein